MVILGWACDVLGPISCHQTCYQKLEKCLCIEAGLFRTLPPFEESPEPGDS